MDVYRAVSCAAYVIYHKKKNRGYTGRFRVFSGILRVLLTKDSCFLVNLYYGAGFLGTKKGRE